jgi:signal transduction histidine kinase
MISWQEQPGMTMPAVAVARVPSRDQVVRAYTVQGVAGCLLMLVVSWLRADEPGQVISELGSGAPLLIAIFFAVGLFLSFLKFRLTDEIFVSLALVAFIAMVPLLGMVLAAWIAVAAVVVNRVAEMSGLTSSTRLMDDRRAEYARTFGLFGTYGIPILAAALCYEGLGGMTPLAEPSIGAALQISAAGIVLIVTNSLVMSRIQQAYGYSARKIVRSTATDITILASGVPFAFITAFAGAQLGWFGVAAAGFSGVLVNWVVRGLAFTRSANQKLVERLSSLTNIGTSISISGSRDELLMAIYTECKRVVDTGIFSIALVDAQRNELSAELFIENGQQRPKFRAPIGKGLNSWVVQNRKPLLMRTSKDELLQEVKPVDDGLLTESWLGVPMILQERVIGAISVQSFRRNAFSEDDLVLLTAVANQAAVAIENSQLYQDLESLYLALEERVAERTVELREANLQLIAADGTKSRFLAHMSHELRTPLNSIIGFSDILLDRLENEISPRLYRFIDNIHVAGTHLLTLINEILDLSKIEAGKLDLAIESFELNETIGSVDRVIKGFATESEVAILTTIASDVGAVKMDEGRVKQILLNLLSNAVKFSPRGDFVRLAVAKIEAAESPLLTESVKIEVSDNGPGIPPEEFPRIFDEFYQASHSGVVMKGGTGLGLPLTRLFVELHSGTIEVESEPGHGATFRVWLPTEPIPTAAPRQAMLRR